jgi:NTE family protein
VKAAGVPIDHYSYEATELLRDKQAQWQSMRRLRESRAFAANNDTAITKGLRTPDTMIYAIDVSFAQLTDQAELDYLNEQATSFSLSAEAVDRLRAAAGKIIMTSPEFQRLLQDVGGKIVSDATRTGAAATVPARK